MIAVASIVTMLFFGILGATFNFMTANRLASAMEDLQSAEAFYVAEGGMQYVAMSQLNGDTDFSDNVSPTGVPFGGTPISLGLGQFWVEYTDQVQASMKVKITATVGNSVRVIEQGVAQTGTSYQYVTMAGGNINMNSSDGDIYGDVGLRGNTNIDEDVVVHGNIVQDPTIVLPTMDLSVYEAMCTVTFTGNKTFSSNYTGNACVTGNVTINANVTYTGVLYAGGNVSINGNNVVFNGSVVAQGSVNGNNRSGLQFNAQSSPDVHMPAIANGGNLNLTHTDDMEISGVIWNAGNLDFTGAEDLNYTGSFMAGGNILLNQGEDVMITFDADLLVGVPGLSGVGGGQSGSLSLSGWRTYAPW